MNEKKELFPSLKRSLGTDPVPKDEIKIIPTCKTVEYNISTILQKIYDIDSLNEEEIKNIIVQQHQTILNYDLFLSKDITRKYAQQLFSNKRFLMIFLKVINLISLTHDEIICINKLAYDYYILPNKNAEISELLLNVSYTVNTYQANSRLVIRLSGILSMNAARVLSMISMSSFTTEKIVHRVNRFILKYQTPLSIQNIIDIYCIIFPHFEAVFVYSMMESKLEITDPIMIQRFDDISSALLCILDSMISEDIKSILTNYAFTLKFIKNNSKVRFSLKTATNYPRIQKIIKEVELNPIDTLIIP